MAKILVVDDEPLLRALLRESLEQAGHTVVEAADGPSGLRTAKADPPDCILLDIMMPVLDGYDACELLKADPDLAVVPVHGGVEADQLTREEEVPMSGESGTSEARPTILCVDDDRLVLGLCTSALEARGYRVLTVPDGLAGIEVALQERPDLILLDVMMPGMDGFEVCGQLRADPSLQHPPVILMTAMNVPDLEVRGAAVGATRSIRKPFSIEQVVQVVETVLGRKASPGRSAS